MNKEGYLAQFESEEQAKKAGYDTSLSKSEFDDLRPRNRKQRRARLAELRRKK